MPLRLVVATIAIVSLLVACAARPPARTEVTTLPPFDTSLSRVFVSAGIFYNNAMKLCCVNQVGPVYFNGLKVGETAPNEHFVVDVMPATYEVSCEPFQPDKNFVEKRSMTFSAGQTTHVACDMAQTTSGALAAGFLGVIGTSLSTYVTKTYPEQRPLEIGSKLVGYSRVP